MIAGLIFVLFMVAATLTAVLSRGGDSVALTATASSPLSTEARSITSFTTFPVFWVGSEYHGQALDRAFGPTPHGWDEPMLVTYGSCGDEFERGCTPAIVIKSIPRCHPGVGVSDSSMRIRGRAVSDAGNLTVETGSGTVVIYADETTALAVANDMVVANTNAFP